MHSCTGQVTGAGVKRKDKNNKKEMMWKEKEDNRVKEEKVQQHKRIE
jgi:hypothetical protein